MPNICVPLQSNTLGIMTHVIRACIRKEKNNTIYFYLLLRLQETCSFTEMGSYIMVCKLSQKMNILKDVLYLEV